jgi:ankyrin repeat protein
MKTDAEVLALIEEGKTEELVECLERGGWDPNREIRYRRQGSEYSCPVISLGVQTGNLKLVQALIRSGVDRRQITDVLYGAVCKGDVAMIELLISAGAKLDRKFESETVLMRAAMENRESIVHMLIKAGASVSIKGSRGMTALSHALLTKQPHERITSILLAAGCPVDGRDLHNPIAMREFAVVEQLLAAGCDVNTPYDWSTAWSDVEKGDTPLIVAVAMTAGEAMGLAKDKPEERLAIIDSLIARGADVTVQRRSNGLTPLHLATILDDVEVAERLIAAGADVKQEYECKLTKLPLSRQRNVGTKRVSAVTLAEMWPQNTKIRALLLRI